MNCFVSVVSEMIFFCYHVKSRGENLKQSMHAINDLNIVNLLCESTFDLFLLLSKEKSNSREVSQIC